MQPWAFDPAVIPLKQASPARFLAVKRGDAVVVAPPGEPWWIGRAIAVHGGAREPQLPSFVQAFNVDNGKVVATLNADAVVEILN